MSECSLFSWGLFSFFNVGTDREGSRIHCSCWLREDLETQWNIPWQRVRGGDEILKSCCRRRGGEEESREKLRVKPGFRNWRAFSPPDFSNFSLSIIIIIIIISKGREHRRLSVYPNMCEQKVKAVVLHQSEVEEWREQRLLQVVETMCATGRRSSHTHVYPPESYQLPKCVFEGLR